MAKKTETDRGTSARCFKKGVKVVLGPIGFDVNFFPPRRSHSDDLISLCPTCLEEAKQKYWCEEHDHGPFSYGEIVRGFEAGQPVASAEEIKAVKGVEDSDEFNLFRYPAADVEASTYPVGTPYVMRPVPGTPAPLYPMVMAKIGADGRVNMGNDQIVTLVGEVVLKGNRKLMQLRTWKGHLVAQELCRPESLHEFEELSLTPDDRFEQFVDDSIDLIGADFDPESFADQARQRVAEFTAARAEGGEVIALPVRDDEPARDDSGDMFAQLAASVAMAKKSAKTTTSKKKAS